MKPVERAFFPLDEHWQISGAGSSDKLRQQMVWLSAMLPYQQASQVLEHLARVVIPKTTLWEQTRQAGKRLQAAYEQHQRHVGIEHTNWEQQHYAPDTWCSISMDGGMVHIRGEGWKEVKVGMVSGIAHDFDNEQQPVRLVDTDYTAVLGDVNQFRPALWALASKHRVMYAGHSAITADGAEWIWKVADDLFPGSLQIVDWYHARQQLSTLADLRHEDDPVAAQRWFQRQSTALYHGESWRIVKDVARHNPDVSTRYFETHQRRMHYANFRAAGFPIGSGGVESGIKQFKQRLSGPGMRWSRQGAEQMLVIRAAVMTDSLPDLWDAA